MHKLGLKIWSTNDFYIKPALALHKNGVLDYIELFVVPSSKEKYLSQWQELDIPIILHAPHSHAGLNLSVGHLEKTNRELIKEVEAFRKALDPAKIIFHPGTNGTLEETIRQTKSFQKEFLELFKIVLMENKPKVGTKGEDCLGAAPDEMKTLLHETALGFCLDMGHAICYSAWRGIAYDETLDAFMRLGPKMYHLSDGDSRSKTDMHLNLGRGNFDLKKIIARIPANAYVSLETDKSSQSNLDDFNQDVIYFRKCTCSP